jgi:antitoxin VapB
MPLTRTFKSGDSQAVRTPAELAYADTGVELVITRLGDVITIQPTRQSLRDAVAMLRQMPRPAPEEVVGRIEVPTAIGIEGWRI